MNGLLFQRMMMATQMATQMAAMLDQATGSHLTPQVQARLGIEPTNPGIAAPGAQITITYRITNTGNVPVSGIRIRKTGTGINYGNVGLFGYLDKGSNVHDVHLTDARITGYEDVGGIAGYTYGTVSGCSVTDSYITATGNWICGTICG